MRRNSRVKRKRPKIRQLATCSIDPTTAIRSSEELRDVHARLKTHGGFTVRAERCENCLFSPDRLTTCADAVDIVVTTRENGSFFGCHRYTDFDEPYHATGPGTYSPTVVCCRGYFDVAAGDSKQIRMAAAFGIICFVDDDGKLVQPLPKAKRVQKA